MENKKWLDSSKLEKNRLGLDLVSLSKGPFILGFDIQVRGNNLLLFL